MDKETLSNYGWIVIAVLVLAVMIALATPFGQFIATSVQNTTEALFDTKSNALDAAGVEHMQAEFENAFNESFKDPALNPDDGTTPIDGETYEHGDYTYTYVATATDYAPKGWKVTINLAVTDKNQTTYGAILESINGEPVTSIANTFQDCKLLTNAPKIPSTITNMDGAFWHCETLVNLPNVPSGVKQLNYTFGFTAITDDTLPSIAYGVTRLDSTFQGCPNITDISSLEIPSTVKELWSTFLGCPNLTTLPKIPYGVVDMTNAFYGCPSITDLGDYVIPNSVTVMAQTFYNCTSLTTAPIIPSSVTNLTQTFGLCTSLTGTTTINGNVSSYSACFGGVNFANQNLILTGTSTQLDALGATGSNYCADCNGKCNGGH